MSYGGKNKPSALCIPSAAEASCWKEHSREINDQSYFPSCQTFYVAFLYRLYEMQIQVKLDTTLLQQCSVWKSRLK